MAVIDERPSGTDVVAHLEGIEVSFTVPGPAGMETRRALDGVSIEIREGEMLVLVGRSGCGKTTVLNLLAGLVASSAGEARVTGRPPAEARDQVAYMFARDALLPWRSARRNVEFALELRDPQFGRRERRARAQEFLDLLDVGGSAHFYPWQLSQGMRQRVALARTWAIDPRLLLMDEPFAALDAQTRGDAQAKFLDVWSSHRRTVLFVTHDLSEAIILADRILVMGHGRIIDEVEIDIPRPRDAETLVLEEGYRRVYERLAAALHHETNDQEH